VDLLIVELTKVIMSIVMFIISIKANVLTNIDQDFFTSSSVKRQ